MMTEGEEEPIISVMFTIDSITKAKAIAHHLLNKKLVACANMFPVESAYWWNDGIKEAQEYMVVMKAKDSDYERIEKEILAIHPYEIPCIVKYDVPAGFRPYLEWIVVSTQHF